MAISTDGRFILTGDPAFIKVWDVSSHSEVRSFSLSSVWGVNYLGGNAQLPPIAFASDNQRMLSSNAKQEGVGSTLIPGYTRFEANTKGAVLYDLSAGRAVAGKDLISADAHFGAEATGANQLTVTDLKTGASTKLQTDSAIAFSEDASYILTKSSSGTALDVWDVKTRHHILSVSFDGFDQPTSIVSERAEQLLLMQTDGSIDAYSLRGGEKRHIAPSDSADGKAGFVLSPTGREVARTGPAGEIDIYDLASGERVLAFPGDESVPRLDPRTGGPRLARDFWSAFSADEKWFAAGNRRETGPWLRVWELPTGRLVLHREAFSIAFSADSQTAVLAPFNQGTPILHDLVTGKDDSFGSGIQNLMDVDVTTDSRFAVTNSLSGSVRIWDVETGRQNAAVGCPDGMPMRAARPSPTQIAIVIVCADGSTRLVDSASGELIEMLNLNLSRSRSADSESAKYRTLYFSRDGKQLAVVDDRRIVIWDLAGHHLVGQIDTSSEPIELTEGQHLLEEYLDSAEAKKAHLETAGRIRALAVDAPSHAVAVLRWNRIAIWDYQTGKRARIFDAPRGVHRTNMFSNLLDLTKVRELAFSADGTQLYAIPDIRSADGTQYETTNIRWDVQTGVQIGDELNLPSLASELAANPTDTFNSRVPGYGALSPDGKLWAHVDGKTIKFSASSQAEGRDERVLAGHTTAVASVVFTPDGKTLLSVGQDGALRIWNVEQRRELAACYGLGDADYLTITPDNYYLASRNELRGVSFRVHGELYPYEQFDLRFDRPDIVMQRLGRASADEIQGYRVAYERRIKKLGFTEQMLQGDFHLPEVRIQTPVSAETKQSSLALQVEAFDETQQLDRFNVYVNDVPVFGSAGLPASGRALHREKREIVVPLIPGTNKVQVSVLNQQGVESLKQTVYTVSNVSLDSSDVYIVGIGVSHYRNSKYDLHYAAKDAVDLMRLYKNAMERDGLHGSVHLLDLTDDRATRAQIIRARDWLKQTHPNDLVIVFAAGHGMTDEQQNYYFGTYDIDPDRPQLNGLPYEELEGLLDGIPALKKLLLVDTCFSGEIDKDEPVTVARPIESSDGTVKMRAFKEARGIVGAEAARRQAKHYQDVFVDLRRGTGAVVISSAGADEYALEGGQWHNGIFTYAVLSGLNGEADTNRDGTITASELQTYVLVKVRQMTGGAQNPTIRRQNLDFDFPIFGKLATAQ